MSSLRYVHRSYLVFWQGLVGILSYQLTQESGNSGGYVVMGIAFAAALINLLAIICGKKKC